MLLSLLKFRSCAFLGAAILCLAWTQTSAQAAALVFSGPQDANGNTCDPAAAQQNHCIIGDPLEFQMFNLVLTQPNAPGGGWRLEINTNYGTPLPGTTEVIPAVRYGNAMLAMCDFMIQWDDKYYGIVLHAHDDYTPGHLYQVTGFQNSGDVLAAQGETSVRPRLPVMINPNGSEIGSGTLSAAANIGADGISQARYKVTVDFQAPPSFLATGDFKIYACSFTCANGYISGTGNFVVPEPATWSLLVLGIGALAWKRRK